MFVVGRLGSYLSRRVYAVFWPVRSFSGAIDIVVVRQPDGTFKSSPWCVRFGKIQRGFKATEKVVSVIVNGVNADFDMYLDSRRETFFYREVEVVEGELEPYALFGEVMDVNTDLTRALKSKSYNFDADRSDLDSELKSSKGSILPQNNTRRGRHFRVRQKSMNLRSGSSKIHPFLFNILNSMQGKCLDSEPLKEVANMDADQPKVSKRKMRAKAPTSEQLASLKLKEGKNDVNFTFFTAMLGKQQVDARIFLWKWNTRIVISDVDGTITKSDLLGQFMHMMGMDWSQTGVTHLFSAIKENGYELLFVSARSISQAYHTRQFLFNLKQDGKELPDGPVLISPDGLFPSLYREVISRTPHEFKISCLEVIRLLFPLGHNPFYAGFGNRDTDEISYLRVGIPIEKIFIINPKGQIAGNRRVDTKSYASLHALVQGMFPPAPVTEQED